MDHRSIVESGRPSMRKITQQSVMKKHLRIGEAKRNTQRERERGTKNILIHKMQQLQNNNNNLYKRLQSHFM